MIMPNAPKAFMGGCPPFRERCLEWWPSGSFSAWGQVALNGSFYLARIHRMTIRQPGRFEGSYRPFEPRLSPGGARWAGADVPGWSRMAIRRLSTLGQGGARQGSGCSDGVVSAAEPFRR